jgi:hypothetical protein
MKPTGHIRVVRIKLSEPGQPDDYDWKFQLQWKDRLGRVTWRDPEIVEVFTQEAFDSKEGPDFK